MLIPNATIVRTCQLKKNWPKGHVSTVKLSFEKTQDGTKLSLYQVWFFFGKKFYISKKQKENIPKKNFEDVISLWHKLFWKRMQGKLLGKKKKRETKLWLSDLIRSSSVSSQSSQRSSSSGEKEIQNIDSRQSQDLESI